MDKENLIEEISKRLDYLTTDELRFVFKMIREVSGVK